MTVAPLTTTVINSVPQHQAGVASGINNAVASLASLLAIAILGAVALNAHDRALDRRAASSLTPEVRQALSQARGKFTADVALQGEERKAAQQIVRQSLHAGIDLAFWFAAALALLDPASNSASAIGHAATLGLNGTYTAASSTTAVSAGKRRCTPQPPIASSGASRAASARPAGTNAMDAANWARRSSRNPGKPNPRRS